MDHTQSNSVPTGRASILTFPYIAQSQGDTINANRWVNSSISHNRFMANGHVLCKHYLSWKS